MNNSPVLTPLTAAEAAEQGHKSLFDRFLDHDGPTMPDIDLDFVHTHRNPVRQYIENRWGAQAVAEPEPAGATSPMNRYRDLVANSQTMLDSGAPFSGTDIAQLLTALGDAVGVADNYRQRFLNVSNANAELLDQLAATTTPAGDDGNPVPLEWEYEYTEDDAPDGTAYGWYRRVAGYGPWEKDPTGTPAAEMNGAL